MKHFVCRLFTCGATLFALTSSLSAQTHPSFDGTWVLARATADTQRVTSSAGSGDGAFRVGDMGSGWGATLTLSQRAGRLVLEYPYFAEYDLMAPLQYEFAMDGSDVENDLTIGPERTRLVARIAWRGDTLLVTTRQAVPREVAPAGVMAEVRRTLSLVQTDTLLVVTTRVGVADAPTNVVRSVYTRKR